MILHTSWRNQALWLTDRSKNHQELYLVHQLIVKFCTMVRNSMSSAEMALAPTVGIISTTTPSTLLSLLRVDEAVMFFSLTPRALSL